MRALPVALFTAIALTPLAQMSAPASADAPVVAPSPPTVVACDHAASVAMPRSPGFPGQSSEAVFRPATVSLRVSLDANGTLYSAEIVRSGGSLAVDQAALRTVRESTWSPAKKNCKAVPASYVIKVDFESPDTIFVDGLAAALPPTPPPTACDHAATVVNPVSPAYPDSAREVGLGDKTVEINVILDATGAITGTRVVESSGSSPLDAAAVDAARSSTYHPAMRNCKPIPGNYLFRAEFTSNT